MFFNRIINKFHLSLNQTKIISNVLWAITGKIVTLFSTLVVGILVARYLGPDQYGLMNYIISFVTLFTVFATFGTTEIIIRELAKKKLPKEIILGSAFRVRICLSIITYLFIGLYLLLANESAETTLLILIYASSIFFSSFDVIRFYFTSIIENKYVVKSEIFRTILGAMIKIILLICKAPLIAFIIALTLDFILLASGYIVTYRKNIDSLQKWSIDNTFIKELLSTSFPLLISGAAMIIYQRIDQVMIAKMINNEAVGYFSTAASFVGVVTFIPTIMVQTISPILVKLWETDKKRYKAESQRAMNITTWITIFISIVLAIFSKPIIRYTYGIEYLTSIPVLQILSFKAVGIALITLGGQLTIIENIHKWAWIRNFLSCIVCVVCNYVFIPKWGIIGSAWGTIITVFFTGCFSNLLIPQYIHILKKQLKALFLGYIDLFNLRTYRN